jgi:hypothetical protein
LTQDNVVISNLKKEQFVKIHLSIFISLSFTISASLHHYHAQREREKEREMVEGRERWWSEKEDSMREKLD